MHGQVVGASIGTANAFDPAIASLQLGIPAVGSVVGHFIGHVLTESKLARVHTQLEQEELDTRKEVPQSFVVYQASLNSLANGHLLNVSLARRLHFTVKQRQLDVLDLIEATVLLTTLWVHVVLDLRHEELAHTQKTGTRRDLVPERLANRGRSKRHGLLVEVQQFLEVQELALGRLRTQITRHVAAGSDSGLEHQVERHRGEEVAIGRRVPDVVLGNDCLQLGTIVVVNLCQCFLVLLD